MPLCAYVSALLFLRIPLRAPEGSDREQPLQAGRLEVVEEEGGLNFAVHFGRGARTVTEKDAPRKGTRGNPKCVPPVRFQKVDIGVSFGSSRPKNC